MTLTAEQPPENGIEEPKATFETVYFDIQSEIDLIKHPDSLDATNESIDLCALGVLA